MLEQFRIWGQQNMRATNWHLKLNRHNSFQYWYAGFEHAWCLSCPRSSRNFDQFDHKKKKNNWNSHFDYKNNYIPNDNESEGWWLPWHCNSLIKCKTTGWNHLPYDRRYHAILPPNAPTREYSTYRGDYWEIEVGNSSAAKPYGLRLLIGSFHSLWTVSGGYSVSSWSFRLFSLKLAPLALTGDCPAMSADRGEDWLPVLGLWLDLGELIASPVEARPESYEIITAIQRGHFVSIKQQ